MTGLLAPLSRTELDVLTADIEHAYRVAHIALVNAPLRQDALIEACGVAQDVMGVMMDCYDESMRRLAAEFDRAFLDG